MTMRVLELSDYSLAACGGGGGIRGFSFALAPGDVCAIDCRNPDDARIFLKALATLVRPVGGNYRFMGQLCDFRDREAMLNRKKRIGYVSPGAALISNLTVRQNLLLQRYYYENRLDIDLDEDVRMWCGQLGLQDKLDRRPAGLNPPEVQAAMIVREMSKKPQVMIMELLEEFIGHSKFKVLIQIFTRWIADRLPLVLFSSDRRIIRLANRKVVIADGTLKVEAVGDTSAPGFPPSDPGPPAGAVGSGPALLHKSFSPPGPKQ